MYSGQWTFTLFTESRGVSVAAAGALTSIFWAMLTLGRVVFGAAAQRIGINRLLRLSMIATVGASALVVIGSVWTGFLGIALLGLTLSIIFPTLTAETPNRVGVEHAANGIGLQTGGASIGFAVMPGLAGALAEARRAGEYRLGACYWVAIDACRE
ncbi:MAG: MFS transporter [Chloroflexota bacterium]